MRLLARLAERFPAVACSAGEVLLPEGARTGRLFFPKLPIDLAVRRWHRRRPGELMSAREHVADYLGSAETLRKRELVWGMVREPVAPYWSHQDVVTRATVLLYEHVDRHGLGSVCASPVDVVLDEDRGLVVQPDVVFVSTDRQRLIDDQVWGAPDLVVEVESPGTRQRDRVWKRRWYRQYGVREYWLIDVDQEAITVFYFGPTGRPTRRVFRGATAVRSTVLPAFAEPASAFFPRR